MLLRAKELKGYKIISLDGEIGSFKEFYFDDLHWTARYLVVDTGSWLPGRQVLLSPRILLVVTVENERHISVDLTRNQIENSPSIETDKPVSRQFEEAYHGYYGWPNYWNGPHIWGASPYIDHDRTKVSKPTPIEKPWDPHLRSTREVSSYSIEASDGAIGHVDDFVIDDETWAVRYLIIETRNWMPEKKILLSPRWIERVSWGDSKVFVNLTREYIRKSPEFSETALLTRDYEAQLHRYYDRQEYWVYESAIGEEQDQRSRIPLSNPDEQAVSPG